MFVSTSQLTVAICCDGARGRDKEASGFLSSSSASPGVTKGRHGMQVPMEKRKDFTDRLVGPEGVAFSVPSQLVCKDIVGTIGARKFFVCLFVLSDHLSDT